MNIDNMWKFLRKKPKKEETSITCGDRDGDGFCDTYINGVKSNVRMLVFSPQEVEKLNEVKNNIINNLKTEKMGKYINQNSTGSELEPLGKAKALISDGAVVQTTPKYVPGKSVCVVENEFFDAAAYAFSEEEFMVFLNDDSGRRKTFLVYEHAEKLGM
jgi:hypothetical protein